MPVEDNDIPVIDGGETFPIGVNRLVQPIRYETLWKPLRRDGFFRVLKDIELGDSIDMLTTKGKKEFVVSSITIVDPTDVSVLAPTDDSTITLVTCYPFYFVGHAPKRYIVKGELLSNKLNKS